jgi:hypothetical protein
LAPIRRIQRLLAIKGEAQTLAEQTASIVRKTPEYGYFGVLGVITTTCVALYGRFKRAK